MLKQNTPYIRVFKLVTSEEIIARVSEETESYYMIERPLQPVQSDKGIRLVPYFFMADLEKASRLNKALVMIDASPPKDIESLYESVISGIALPTKSSIIT